MKMKNEKEKYFREVHGMSCVMKGCKLHDPDRQSDKKAHISNQKLERIFSIKTKNTLNENCFEWHVRL